MVGLPGSSFPGPCVTLVVSPVPCEGPVSSVPLPVASPAVVSPACWVSSVDGCTVLDGDSAGLAHEVTMPKTKTIDARSAAALLLLFICNSSNVFYFSFFLMTSLPI